MDDLFEVEDIITNILAKLPVKSLILCKSVSKRWRGLISSPNFMRLQLLRSKERPTYVFYPYICWDRKVHFLTKTDGETTETLSSCNGYNFTNMICCFNGLICFISYEGSFYFKRPPASILRPTNCNPATQDVLLLPRSHNILEGTRREYRLEIRICNPATGEVLLLPRSRLFEE